MSPDSLTKHATTMQGRIWIGWEGERLSEQMPLYAGNGTLLIQIPSFQITGIFLLYSRMK